MSVNDIATVLCGADWETVSSRLIPPWFEGMRLEEQELKEVWLTVQQLRRQRDGLIELRPDNRSLYESQCNELIMTEAAKAKEITSISSLSL